MYKQRIISAFQVWQASNKRWRGVFMHGLEWRQKCAVCKRSRSQRSRTIKFKLPTLFENPSKHRSDQDKHCAEICGRVRLKAIASEGDRVWRQSINLHHEQNLRTRERKQEKKGLGRGKKKLLRNLHSLPRPNPQHQNNNIEANQAYVNGSMLLVNALGLQCKWLDFAM